MPTIMSIDNKGCLKLSSRASQFDYRHASICLDSKTKKNYIRNFRILTITNLIIYYLTE